MYAEQYEWGLIWDISGHSQPIQHIIRASLARYSSTFALDLLVGQVDRNNARNVILGVDPGNPDHTEFLFLDHSYALNHQNRWRDDRWKGMEMVPIPEVFRKSLSKDQVIVGARRISELSEATVHEIVERVPDEYMASAQKEIVTAGLLGRRKLIEPFIQANL
jgi:hypothetical protein